jgi:hypothetical protein
MEEKYQKKVLLQSIKCEIDQFHPKQAKYF